MMDLIELGEHIKADRKARGWSQTKLAEESGVSRARIEALENGRIAEIGFCASPNSTAAVRH
jgi:transcriptional regulator with XRE-family HTH domain